MPQKVLIVDDERPFLDLLEEGFKTYRQEFQLATAENGRQAIEYLRKNPVDLVVTDIKMPQMDGFELLSYLREFLPEVPVILMTAFGTSDIEERLRAMGASHYLEKPLDFETLAGRIVEELAQSVSGAVAKSKPGGAKARLLIWGRSGAAADDIERNLGGEGYTVRRVDQASQLIQTIPRERPEAIVLDLTGREDFSGLEELIAELRSQNPLRPVIILARELPLPFVQSLWRAGVSDILLGQEASRELPSSIQRCRERYQHLRGHFTNQLRASYETEIRRLRQELSHELNRILNLEDELSGVGHQMIKILVNAVEIGDPYLRGHSERVAARARMIVEHMNQAYVMSRGMMDLSELEMACLLHDIGKLGVPDSVLNQRHQLSDAEWNLIRRHPELGAEIVANIGRLHNIAADIKHHHERWDGQGYPQGLRGDDIPIRARVISVADAFDAMASPRAYRQPLPLPAIVEEIKKESGTQFDPQVVEGLIALVEKS